MHEWTRGTDAATNAFSELLHRHWGIVVRVAATYARQREDRDELAQEIAAQLWSAWPRYDPARPFTTWMYRVALNTALTYARDARLRQRHVAAVDELPDAPCAVDADADAAILLSQVMAGLDDGSRALLLLHLEARSSQEIADVLGLSVTAVTTRLQRLRQSLRNRFRLD